MDHSEQTRQLEKEPIRVLLWRYSTPAIFAMVVNATYNIVDRIFVGQAIGEIGITATTLAFPAMMIINAFGMLVGVGASTLISIKLGEKKHVDAEKLIGQAIFLFLLMSVVFLVFGLIYMEPMLKLFGATEKSLALTEEYFRVILFGIFFQKVALGVNGFIRAEGQPRVAMVSTLIGAISNTFLDWFFLFVLGTGIWGAAFATILAQAISSIWVLWMYFTGRTLLKIRFRMIRLDLHQIWQIISFGFASFVMQVVGCFLQIFQNHQLKYYGEIYGAVHGLQHGAEIAIAIMGTIFVIYTIFIMPLLGIGQGMQPIVGYNVGSCRFDRVARVFILALCSGFAFSLLCYLCVLFRAEWFIAPFIKFDSPERIEIIALGTRALRIFSMFLPCVGLIVVSTNYFQSRGKPIRSLMLTLVRQVFLLIPMLMFLPWIFESTQKATGLDGIWYAFPAADLGGMLLLVYFLVVEFRVLIRFQSKRILYADTPSTDNFTADKHDES